MSLIDPNRATLSKIKFFLKKNLTTELQEKVFSELEANPKFDGWPLFRIKVYFRSVNPPAPDYLEEKNEIIPDDLFECIDVALNKYTTVKHHYLLNFNGIGHVRFELQSTATKREDFQVDFIDEKPFLPQNYIKRVDRVVNSTQPGLSTGSAPGLQPGLVPYSKSPSPHGQVRGGLSPDSKGPDVV